MARLTRTDPELRSPAAIEYAAHHGLYEPGRHCRHCGARLSIYNPSRDECQPCQRSPQHRDADTTSNPENW